jgi:hypothetical protein
MAELPQCLIQGREFAYRQEILSELAAGATLRLDSRRFAADELIGTYKIRLRIANNASQNDPSPEVQGSVRDMTTLVENLGKIAASEVVAYYVLVEDGRSYHLFVDAESDSVVGCLKGFTVTGAE